MSPTEKLISQVRHISGIGKQTRSRANKPSRKQATKLKTPKVNVFM